MKRKALVIVLADGNVLYSALPWIEPDGSLVYLNEISIRNDDLVLTYNESRNRVETFFTSEEAIIRHMEFSYAEHLKQKKFQEVKTISVT